MSSMKPLSCVLSLVALLGAAACSDETSEQSNNASNNTSNNNTSNNNTPNPQGKATGQGPCAEGDECRGDVCVAIIDGNNPPNYCTQTCTAGSCPSGFFCDADTFALVGLSFCRFGGDPPQGEPAPAPEEPPRRPCKDDSGCDSGEICATYEGERGCTIACTQESQCDIPSVGGITVDFLECAPDPTPGQTRDACLPRAECYTNPQSCIGGFPGL
jgi:hypothetical protein